MKSFAGMLSHHSLIIGILLMFIFTWLLDLASAGIIHLPIPSFLYTFTGYAAALAALLMTGLTLGRKGVTALLKRFLIWRVGWQWYLVALLLYPAIIFASVLLNAAFSGEPIDFSAAMAHTIFGASANLGLYFLPFFLFDLISNGEEAAWRGYVLPRLQSRFGALASSLILGVIWALWHLPLFLLRGTQELFPWFLLRITLDAVIYTWLFNNTRGSLLLVALLHSSGNTAGVFLPIANTATTANFGTLLQQIGILFLLVMGLVAAVGPARLSRTEPKQVTPPADLPAPSLG